MEEVKFKYRDKVNGQWISEPVSGERILELVTRGTLTPYDFVCKEGGGKPQMIRDAFPEAEKHWAMLRKIRVDLNRYWEVQLDSLMSKITMTKSELSFDKLKSSSNQGIQKKEIEDGLLSYWRSAPSDVNKLEKEIKRRHYNNEPEVYSTEDCSFESLKDWMVSKNLDGDFGCYAFFDKKSDTGNCNYIGMTARPGFKTRLKNHFDDPQKTWTENFDEIHFWKINQLGLTNANTQTQNQSERR